MHRSNRLLPRLNGKFEKLTPFTPRKHSSAIMWASEIQTLGVFPELQSLGIAPKISFYNL